MAPRCRTPPTRCSSSPPAQLRAALLRALPRVAVRAGPDARDSEAVTQRRTLVACPVHTYVFDVATGVWRPWLRFGE